MNTLWTEMEGIGTSSFACSIEGGLKLQRANVHIPFNPMLQKGDEDISVYARVRKTYSTYK